MPPRRSTWSRARSASLPLSRLSARPRRRIHATHVMPSDRQRHGRSSPRLRRTARSCTAAPWEEQRPQPGDPNGEQARAQAAVPDDHRDDPDHRRERRLFGQRQQRGDNRYRRAREHRGGAVPEALPRVAWST